jgi:hypothetical protein
LYNLVAASPAGLPYLPLQKELRRSTPNVARQQIRLALARGVLVRGKVIETPSGNPVRGAAVIYEPNQDKNRYFRPELGFLPKRWRPEGVSGARGEFDLVVLPGPGHLLINGPAPVYARAEITSAALYTTSIEPNFRQYPDGLVPLDLKPQAGPHALTVKLRRGVTLKGQVVDPRGKPVKEAVLVSRSYLPHGFNLNPVWPKEVKDGRFELPGCDPDKTVEVFFLDAKNQRGATVKRPGKEAGKPLTVRLQPCGQARARFVDSKGKPVSGLKVHVELLITPGVAFADAFSTPGPTADTCHLSQLDREMFGHGKLRTDAQGRVTIPALIPGGTFWLIGSLPSNMGLINLNKEFKAEAGKTLDLGDIVVKPQE